MTYKIWWDADGKHGELEIFTTDALSTIGLDSKDVKRSEHILFSSR